MKKRYVLGSVIVALLMLVSTQIVFLNTVKSDPTRHTGDADVGDLWISELDVSSDLATIDYVGISHVNATEDWVYWQSGSGNINASYSVDIERNHPEYYVIFTFEVINVDDNCNAIGNDTFSKTYNANTDYDESGTLSVALSFTQQQQQAGFQALVCILGAYVQINNTVEAVNFSCIAQDRCVVAVDFDDPPRLPPFSKYRDDANDDFPSMWSWIDGWNEGGKFSDEDDMLNNQPYFVVTNGTLPQPDGNDKWHIGNLTLEEGYFGLLKLDECSFTVIGNTTNWSLNANDTAVGVSYCNYTVEADGLIKQNIRLRILLDASEEPNYTPVAFGGERWKPSYGYGPHGIKAYTAASNGSDKDHDGNISIDGWIWAANLNIFSVHLSDYDVFNIHIDSNANQTSGGSSSSYYWKYSCAYQNQTSDSLPVSSSNQSGITTVRPDISNVLSLTNGNVYSFAADRGDTRIEFVV